MPVRERQARTGKRIGGGRTSASWDQWLLWEPLNTLSARGQWLVIVLTALLITGWGALLNGNLMRSWGLPDVVYYVRMAQGRFDLVPAPFSARPLVPLLARWIAAPGHWWVEAGFAIVAFASVLWASGVVVWLALRSAAPRWTVLLLASVPFWQQLVGDAGLPDAFYTALLAMLLLCLQRGALTAAALLLFPLMLTRESTTLLLVCLLAVGWRRFGWYRGALAVVSTALATLVVRYLSRNSLPNPEHMSGGLYLVGKVLSNTARSVGIRPWSNVYPALCSAPRWQHALHLGPVRSVGICRYDPSSFEQASLALGTTFGVLPLLLVFYGRGWRRATEQSPLLVRFCLLYGGISLLIAPTLGTWYERLFGYGWPLLLVAVPRLLGGSRRLRQREARPFALAVVLLHLLLAAFTPVLYLHWVAWAVALCLLLTIALLLVQHYTVPRPLSDPE